MTSNRLIALLTSWRRGQPNGPSVDSPLAMNSPVPPADKHGATGERLAVFPLAVWLLVQLIALTAGALDIAWSANYPSPAHLQSLQVMLITQLAGATLLAPWLGSSRGSIFIAALVVWPFIQAAGFLSAGSLRGLGLSSFYTSTWILVLGVLHGVKSHPLLPTITAATSVFVLFDPILAYLSREFTGRQMPGFGPISAAFQLAAGEASWHFALAPAGVLVIALVLRGISHRHV
jgi:hypothetical protein